MSSTPVAERAAKSAPVEKVEESTSTKPVLQDEQAAKPGEPSTHRAKQHKTVKVQSAPTFLLPGASVVVLFAVPEHEQQRIAPYPTPLCYLHLVGYLHLAE